MYNTGVRSFKISCDVYISRRRRARTRRNFASKCKHRTRLKWSTLPPCCTMYYFILFKTDKLICALLAPYFKWGYTWHFLYGIRDAVAHITNNKHTQILRPRRKIKIIRIFSCKPNLPSLVWIWNSCHSLVSILRKIWPTLVHKICCRY